MKYNINLIKNTDYNPTYWSGGMASELITYPDSSSFTNRNFLWRLGYAKISIDTSTFSNLPNIKRHLMVTSGEMTLAHKDKYSKTLKPFEQDFFMGDWHTTTEGQCSVFNLMTRENYDGILSHIELSPQTKTFNYSYENPNNFQLIACCIHPLNNNVEIGIDEKYFKIDTGDLLNINLNSNNILPEINLHNTDSNNIDVIVSLIFKN